MRSVYVELGEKSYPIFLSDNWIDLFKEASGYLTCDKALIITDQHVYPQYCREVEIGLQSHEINTYTVVVPPGEASKSFLEAEKLFTKALKAGLDRKSLIIALGGGVIGDLAGFVASTYMRGIPFIQIPTSLLAQVDSSVGGKVAINHPLAKNIIGSFYQPQCVLMNISTLATLPDREMSTGMAELIKHGIIRDDDLLEWLRANMDKMMGRDIQSLTNAIARSCEIKAEVVSQDEKEQGLRAILNFGHTVGHAIESISGYGVLSHGEAVSIGMVAEAYIAQLRGLIEENYVNHMKEILISAGLPVTIPGLDMDQLIELMRHDKKNTQGNIVFVLPTAPGEVDVFRDVTEETIKRALVMTR